MKNKLVLGLILIIMLFAALPYSAGAADEDFLKYTSSGNAFGGGDNLQINRDIQGDLVLAGSLLEINGNIADDFIGAGGELIINGNVSGNIIAAGASIKVNGDVGGDVAVAGGQVFLSQDSVVEGDILVGGAEVTLNGVVNGNGEVSAGTLRTGNNFELNGDLAVEAENYPSNLDENVGGNLSITPTTAAEERYEEASEGFGFLSFIIELLAALALGLILIYLFPNFVSQLAGLIRDSPLKVGLLGFLILIFLPVVSIVLLLTIFGWSLSILIILLLALMLLIATIPVKLLIGEIIYNRVFKKDAGKMVYYLVGVIILTIAYEIPLVGGLIRFIALLIGLGTIAVWLALRAKSET